MLKKIYTIILLLLFTVLIYCVLALSVPSIGLRTRELIDLLEFRKDQFDEVKKELSDVQFKTPEKDDNITDFVKKESDLAETLGKDKNKAVKITYIDVNQGDATLIESAGEYMLIDTGNWDSLGNVLSTLEEYNVKELSALVLTHDDVEHTANADELVYKYPIKRLFLNSHQKNTQFYQNLVSAIHSQKRGNALEIGFPVYGDKIPLGNVVFDVLGPVKGKTYNDANSYSIILKLTNYDDTFLFTGDATEEEIKDAAEEGADFSAKILKLSHHGSSNGCNSKKFLNAVNAISYIVSCGRKNSYGHPHIEVMNYAKNKGINIYRTDIQGTIVCISYGNIIDWNKPSSNNYTNGSNL